MVYYCPTHLQITKQKVFIAISNTVFYHQVWTGTVHAAQLFFLIQAIKSFICGIVVAVAHVIS